MSDKRFSDEMLADYAAGSLSPEDAREVERFLAESTDRAAPLLAKVRASEPRPKQEPDWDAMYRGITQACDQAEPDAAQDIEAQRGRSGWRRFWQSVRRPRFAIGFTALATAAAVLAIVWMQSGKPGPESTQIASVSFDAGVRAVARVAKQPTELRDAELADLEVDELDRVFESLQPNQMRPDAIAQEAGAGQAPMLAPELVAEWTSDTAPGSEEDHLGLGLFSDTDYGTDYGELLDTVNDDDLDRVEALLAADEGKAG